MQKQFRITSTNIPEAPGKVKYIYILDFVVHFLRKTSNLKIILSSHHGGKNHIFIPSYICFLFGIGFKF